MNCTTCEKRARCFFSDIHGTATPEVDRVLVKNKYKKGQVIVYEGMAPQGLYVLCEGEVKVYKSDEAGHQLALRLCREGDLLGFRSLLLGVPYGETVEVLRDSVIGFLDREAFGALIGKYHALMLKLLRFMAAQLGETEEQALKMAFYGAHRRIAEILLEAKAHTAAATGGVQVVHLPFRRQELAELAGLAVETTIRTLKSMEADEMIRVKGRQVFLLDPRKLASLAEAA